jgi:hypothetical protein
MTRSSIVTALLTTAYAAVVAALLSASVACVGTPLPDPPSVRPEALTLTSENASMVRLTGADGAIDFGDRTPGGMLRVTVATLPARVEVPVSTSGAFTAVVGGTLADTLHLELVSAPEDAFLAAVAATADGVGLVGAGPDVDRDGSPDAVDCAPTDPIYGARECIACASDADCMAGETCAAGICQTSCSVEVCGNGLDDDCDGIVDDCGCTVDGDCGAGQVCLDRVCVAG